MKNFFTGNLLLIVCCAFYLAWWLIAFKPEGAIKGLRSGWLLIPAALAGVLAVVLIVRGITATDSAALLVPTMRVVWIGAAAYVVLLLGTYLLMKRPVTTELVLIVGWAVLAVSEVSVLYGHEVYGSRAAWIFIAVIILMAAVSLVCYLLYYKLDAVKGYYDGIAPLAIVAVVTAVMTVTMK